MYQYVVWLFKNFQVAAPNVVRAFVLSGCGNFILGKIDLKMKQTRLSFNQVLSF